MTVVPVNVTAVEKEQAEAAKARYKTEAGWIYPGKKTMIESNVHPMKPHLARVDDIYQVRPTLVISICGLIIVLCMLHQNNLF